MLLLLSMGSFLLPSCIEPSGPVHRYPQTYCNPINIDYTYSVVQTSKGLSYRSGADPAVVRFRDVYYLFVTRSQGYWRSKDLHDWEFIRPQNWYFESSNAPAAWPMGDSILVAMGNPAAWQSVIYTDDPGVGTWRGAASLVPLSIHDPALFIDDDGRVYLYHESSNKFPIQGVELDPKKYYLPAGENKELFGLVPEQHGWERFGENHGDTVLGGYIEGAWMNKHNGTYYLQYAAPGTQWNVYGDGVYTSDDPLGPFRYEEYSPFSYKPGGFIRGAGHGSTVQGPYGNYWHYATMVVGINFNFERRIGQFPAGFDADGQLYTNTAYGDYPHYLPSPDIKDRDGWFTGWMLLSYKKPVTASSSVDDFSPEHLVDENIKTYWVAATNENEQVTIDLENECEVRAIQLNYADYRSDIFGKPDSLYHQYLIEHSADGNTWHELVDKSKSIEDVPNDYVELRAPQTARYIRFTNHHVPTPHLAMSDIRIFGKGPGQKPGTVKNFTAVRGEDRRQATLRWSPVSDAQGYHVYFGIAQDKLYNSYMIYEDTTLVLNGLNVAPEYFFSIEAFNENGVSDRSEVLMGE